jgi:hypothetical protein
MALLGGVERLKGGSGGRKFGIGGKALDGDFWALAPSSVSMTAS